MDSPSELRDRIEAPIEEADRRRMVGGSGVVAQGMEWEEKLYASVQSRAFDGVALPEPRRGSVGTPTSSPSTVRTR